MPTTAARTSTRDLGRKSTKQTATRSRDRASYDGDSVADSSEDREHGVNDDTGVLQSTKLQAEASPNAFAPVSHSGPTDHPEENAPPTVTVNEDPNVHPNPTELLRPDSSNYFPGLPLNWEWDSPQDFQHIAQNYEPQGELLNEVSTQPSLEQDFNFREVANDSSQVQICFTNQSRSSDLDHPQLPEQSLPGPPIQSTDPDSKPPHIAGEKRKSIPATDIGPSGTQSDPAAKRVAFSADEASVAPELATANLQAQQYRNGGILRRGSEGPEPNASSQAEPSRKRSTAQQEPPPKRSKSNNRRDLTGKKKMALPAGKVFPIQIGSELFRLSGASISSDGKLSATFSTLSKTLRLSKPPHIFRISLGNNYDRQKTAVPRISKLYILTEIQSHFEISPYISKVSAHCIGASEPNTSAYPLNHIRLSRTTSRWTAFCEVVCRCSILQL